MYYITAARFRYLMRKHGWTIRTLASKFQVPQTHVRELRDYGLAPRGKSLQTSYHDAVSWYENLTGRNIFDRARYDRLAAGR